MDRSPHRPHFQSLGTPTLVHPLIDPSESHEEEDHAALFDFFRRDPGDGSFATHSRSGQHPSTGGAGETWLDFLRDSGARDNHTAEPSAMGPPYRPMHPTGETGERKRRLTAPESPARVGYGPSLSMGGGSMSSRPNMGYSLPSQPPPPPPPLHPESNLRISPMANAGGSADVDRVTPRPSASGSSRSRSNSNSMRHSMEESRRRDSDIVLPPWQPDSEVTRCPVCAKQFSFYFRKHHCRKCGRVVCGSCSPHRITIPRQFIVQPPSPTGSGSGAGVVDLTTSADDDDYNPALGGGEEVRVCNPCVPDPNYSLPPQFQQPIHPQYSMPYNAPNFPPRPPPGPHLGPRPRNVTLASLDRPSVFTPGHRPSFSDAGHMRTEPSRYRPRDPFRDGSVSYYQRGQASALWPPPHFVSNRPDGSSSYMAYPPPGIHPRMHRHTASSFAGSSSRNRSALDINAPLPPLPTRQPSPSPPPQRRQIPEEDECPVCGGELPPKGPDGDETEREAHIMECIDTSYAPSSSAPPAVSRTEVPVAASPDILSLAGTPPQGSGSSSSVPRNETATIPQRQPSTRARRQTGNRMLIYKATEKDCTGEDGESEECIICFEEFEVGMEMGRLECWCKFHRGCIRQWWETKGMGSCPTHQLHD